MVMVMVKVMAMAMVIVMVIMAMVMVTVMIMDIVVSSISWGRELRCSPWRALRNGLRQLWAVVVPIQLDFRSARRPGPSAATQLRGSRGHPTSDVLVQGLQTKLRAQRGTACFVPIGAGGR